MKVQYDKWFCSIRFATYSNGRTAMVLVSAQVDENLSIGMGDQIEVATVNLVDQIIAPDCVFINEYYQGLGIGSPGEAVIPGTTARCVKNPGLVEALVNAGVIAKPHSYAPSGHVMIPCCKLLVNPRENNE